MKWLAMVRINMQLNRNHLFDEVVMWKTHGRLSDIGIDCMVIDQAIYLVKNDILDDF